MKGRRWRGTGVAILLGLGLTLAGCGQAPPPQHDLRMGVLTTPSTLPYFAMRELGFARRQGLRITEVPFSAGEPLLQGMAEGKADAGYPSTAVLLVGAARGLVPEQVLAVAANDVADRGHPAAAVVAGLSVGGWQGLEGKHIGVPSPTSIMAVALRLRLQQEGVQRYTLVPIPFANMGLAVAGGNVSAGVMLEPYLSQSLLRADGKFLDWIIGGPPLEETLFTLLAVRAELVGQRPEAVKALLRAQLQAARWIEVNPDEARSLLARSLDIPRGIAQRLHMRRWLTDGRIETRLLEPIQAALGRTGGLPRAVDLRQIADQGLLEAVLVEAQ